MRSARRTASMLAGLMCCVSIGTVWAAQAGQDLENGAQIAVLRFHGPLSEAPAEFDLGFDLEPKQSFYDLLECFRKAGKDRQLKAVVLTFDQPLIGLGQMQELRQMILDLRKADKDVYCYLEEAGPAVYQLATSASRVYMVPTGEIHLIGLHVEVAYFKSLLDKIGVEADIEQIGAYKEAGEPFTRTGPSDQAREMLDWLGRDLFDQMVETIAQGRRMSNEEVRELIDRGPFTARQALEAKLVDETLYAEEFAESLRKRYGQQVEFVHDYGAKEAPELNFMAIFKSLLLGGAAGSKGKARAKPSIAVVYVDGLIMPGKTEPSLFGEAGIVGGTTLRRVLHKARKDGSIKAVVLRVDSPGGAATASDIIWHAATQLGKDKPLVVSMGNIAASGGYYVSAGAGTIFADRGTITGSIGVIGGKLVTKGLWDWLGVTFHETSYGRNADLYNSNRRFDDRQRALIREQMQATYDAFTDRVAKGRGGRLKEEIDQVAGGRVFTGRQAQANGLIDRLGGLQEAIEFAAAQANVSDYEIRRLPEPKNLFDLFFRGLTGEGQEDEDIDVTVTTRNQPWTLLAPAVRELLPVLQRLDPLRARTMLRSLLRIELLNRENTLLIMPGEMTIR